jgi:uncharacterized SAM-binding protein YcdF (DUF218 family)
MDAQQLRKIRMSFIVLPIILIALTLISINHVHAVGTTFDLIVDNPELQGVQLTRDNIIIDPPDMATVEDIRMDEAGHQHIRCAGNHENRGQIIVNTPEFGVARVMRVDDHKVVVVDEVNFMGWEAIAYTVVAGFAISTILCAHAAFRLFKRSWYGYEMIGYVSGAIFCLVETLSIFYATFSGETVEFIDFAILVTSLAQDFVGLTLIPMAIMAVCVCVSNISLVRHEGMRPVNLLGIAFSILWILALIVPPIVASLIMNSDEYEAYLVASMLDSVASITVAYFSTLLLSCCVCAWLASRHRPSAPRDTLIILGCGIRADGTPSPLLKGRVDAALGFAAEQEAQGYGPATFVPSGGQGLDECMSEAESMGRYLRSQGIEEDRILLESRSADTEQNMLFSRAIIERAGRLDQPIAFATTNYHVFRGYVWAHAAGMTVEGIAAPTRAYFWPNAFLREFVGIVFTRKFEIVASLALLSALYLAVEYVILLS